MPRFTAIARVLLPALLLTPVIWLAAPDDGGRSGAPATFTVPPDTDPSGPTTPPPIVAEVPAGATGPRVHRAGFSPGISILNLLPGDLERDLDAMAATGAKWLRVDFDWSYVQKAGPGVYDWSLIDRVVQGARETGLSILALAAYTPSWARPPGTSDKHAPLDPDRFAVFVREAAERYAPLGVHAWEIWNEPNISEFWAPLPDPEGYAALLVRAAAAIRIADPEALVISGGLSPAADLSDGSRINDRTFLARVYDAGAGGSFDAVGLHPYSFPALPLQAEDWNTFQSTPALREVMEEHGDGAKQIWGTEFGAPTGAGEGAVSAERQAQILRDGFRAWTRWHHTGPLLWYSYRDVASERGFGLVELDGTRKPAFAAFLAAVGELADVG